MDERTRKTDDNLMPDHGASRDLADRELAPKLRRPAPDPEVRERSYSKLKTGLGLIISLAVVAAAYEIIHAQRTPQQANPRFAPGAVQSVGAAAATPGDVRVMVNALGTVTPLATVTVQTQISGQLTEVGFTEGQMVKKGDFLAQIDPRPYQILKEQYEGQLAHDQGVLAQAQSDLKRYQTLLQQNSIARQQADNQIYVVQQSEGTVKVDQALIDAQKLNIAYCHIVSPVTGRVGLRLVDPGNYVQTSSSSNIAVVTQLQPISVVFSVPEDQLPDIMPEFNSGAALSVTAFDRADVRQLATGKVSAVDNQVDTTTGTVRIRAQFDNTDDSLFPNQFVNVQLLVKTLHGVVTVPSAAIQRGAPGPMCTRSMPTARCRCATSRSARPTGSGGSVRSSFRARGRRSRRHRWRRPPPRRPQGQCRCQQRRRRRGRCCAADRRCQQARRAESELEPSAARAPKQRRSIISGARQPRHSCARAGR